MKASPTHYRLVYKISWFLAFGFCVWLFYPVGYFVFDDAYPPSVYSEPAAIDPQKITAYVINLDPFSERYHYIQSYVEPLQLPTQRIQAIDGDALTTDYIQQIVDLKTYKLFFDHFPKKGTIACSLGHIQVWKNFLESDAAFALVCEDDVNFSPKRLQAVINDLLTHAAKWDFVNFDIDHRGHPLKIVDLVYEHDLAIYLTETSHSGCYLINRKAAARLFEKAFPITMPIDHYFTRAWEFDLIFTGVEHRRLVHQTYFGSEIGVTHIVHGDTFSLIESLNRIRYKLQSYVIRFFYNLKLYSLNKMNADHLPEQ